MDNACKSKYKYANYQEQGGFILPILEVRGCGFDWERLLDVSGVQWNNSFALKRPATMKTVSTFL